VAALMGSKLSDRQADLIATYFDRVILMLDADAAGKAATSAAATSLSSILAVQIVDSPQELSQTNWLQKKSINSWQALLMTFQLQTIKDPFEFHILSRASGDVSRQ